MPRPIVIGIDTVLSLPSQIALQAVTELLEQSTLSTPLLLLTVLPITHVVSAHPGHYVEQTTSLQPSPAQHQLAAATLQKAGLLLQAQGIPTSQIDTLVRIGSPADEIVKLAHEQHACLIVVGSRGSSFRQQLRRIFIGSISRRILHLASCPVMIVLPPIPQAQDLTTWYALAVKKYLLDHHALSVFTPQQVAQQFLPSSKKTAGSQELEAATRALEQLVQAGQLCRHTISDETHYVND